MVPLADQLGDDRVRTGQRHQGPKVVRVAAGEQQDVEAAEAVGQRLPIDTPVPKIDEIEAVPVPAQALASLVQRRLIVVDVVGVLDVADPSSSSGLPASSTSARSCADEGPKEDSNNFIDPR